MSTDPGGPGQRYAWLLSDALTNQRANVLQELCYLLAHADRSSLVLCCDAVMDQPGLS